MTTIKQLTVIRFTQVRYSGRGRSRRVIDTRPVWVETATFADGSGFKVKKVSFTTDRMKAAGFSLIAATEIAAQYYTKVVALERRDGTAMVEETNALRAECLKRNAEAIRRNEEAQAEWTAFFNDMPEDLKASLRGLGIRL